MGEPGPLDLSSNSRLERVLADYSRRVAAGESISRDDLVSRNPGLADALRSHFASQAEAVEPDTSHGHDPDTSHGQDTAMADPGTQYRPRSNQATIPPRLTPVRSCTLPEQFGRYRVVRCLGEGTMGAVYLADDTQLERPVALKIPKFSEDDDDDDLSQRFYREARAAAHLRHANLCPVYDVGEIDGVRYLSMAYIEGRPLSEVLSEGGPLDARAAVTFALKLARALEAAHARGVIHRDLKPANIMIDAHQEPIIMDFGLARQMNKVDSRLTQEGMLMGSPAYMSPEQVEGDTERMGPSCDIYSLGIILYELLTGDVPFKGSIAAVMGQIIGSPPRKLSAIKPGIDPALEAICLKMIAKRLEDRFASMTEVVRALDAYLGGRPTGVVLPPAPDASTAAMPALATQAPPVRGIVIAPWMLVTAVCIVIAGFGVTWGLITTLMKQQLDEVKVNPQTRSALETGKAKAVINGKEIPEDQLEHPIELTEGKNKISVRNDDSTTPAAIGILEVTPGEDQKSYAVYDKDKGFVRKRSHRLLAEWALTHGGRVKLVGSEQYLEAIEDLPPNKDLPDKKLELAELDLAGVKKIPPQRLSSIAEVGSLKRLLLPKAVSKDDREELRKKLSNCTIESAQ
ncbi:MAG TPA: serine/threonine-protein kinase [Planctomycetaceae bacterium]|jgi:predicted Ser/Thr protein kinase|nr:serine/threonine-protein kinase [Planctomycetaceae bacterium]